MRIRFLAAASAFALALLVGCPPAPVPPTPSSDAGAVDAAGVHDCEAWCAHAADLKCPAALPTEHGASCVDVCVNMQASPVSFDLKCRTLAPSCAAADECEADKPFAEHAAPSTCALWCAHALGLGCPAGRKTPAGSPCVDVCNNVMSGPAKFNLKCRIAAKTCAAADACEH